MHWLTFISPISVGRITALKILFACEAFCLELSNISSVDHFMNIWSWNPYIHQSRDISRNIFCVSLTWLTYLSTSKPNVNKVYNKMIRSILCYLILWVRSKMDNVHWTSLIGKNARFLKWMVSRKWTVLSKRLFPRSPFRPSSLIHHHPLSSYFTVHFNVLVHFDRPLSTEPDIIGTSICDKIFYFEAFFKFYIWYKVLTWSNKLMEDLISLHFYIIMNM